ncbi:MAG: hypothetical protein HOM66_05075, partial [Rhodospirillales bacterium]|nr:hypothetical protein [Rhodospirillales bacterium]
MAYFKDHWAGKIPLIRAFWVNGVAVLALCLLAGEIWARVSTLLPHSEIIITSLILKGLALVVGIWQWVGIYRSATRAARSFVPHIAILVATVVALGGVGYVALTAKQHIQILQARFNPALDHFKVYRDNKTDLVLVGAINDQSAALVVVALRDPAIKVLRISSHGGLVFPAAKLAAVISKYKIAVLAEDRCQSVCVLVLAASPKGIVAEATNIAFHQVGRSYADASPLTKAETNA